MNGGVFTHARLIRMACWALCFAPLVVAAEHSGSTPALRSAADGGVFDRARDLGEKTDEERRVRLAEQITPQEWEQAKEFLRKHAPNRFAQMEKAGGPKEKGMRFLVNRWRAIEILQSESPELYNTKVREVELEDDLLGLCLRLKRERGSDPQSLHNQMKTKIADLFDLGVKERTLRIARVESALGEQKKTLGVEIQHRDQLIAERFEMIKSEGVEGARIGLKRALRAGRHASSTEPSVADEPSPGDTPEK